MGRSNRTNYIDNLPGDIRESGIQDLFCKKGWPIDTICVGNLLVAEVVDEVEDDRQMIVDSDAKIEEWPKKSYASILSRTQRQFDEVMHLKRNVACIFPTSGRLPREAPPKIVEPVHAPSAPATHGPVSGSESLDNGNNPDGEADGYSIYIKGLPMNATKSLLEEVFKKFNNIKTDGIQVRSNRVCSNMTNVFNNLWDMQGMFCMGVNL
ncbi:hypothetical protein OROHE_010833 [Orobanche hederae]